MDESLEREVRARASFACEYCKLPDSLHPGPFEIEHVIAQQHGGKTLLSNLAYACLHCNRHKGPNLSGIDWITSRTKLVRLFHPRRHWAGRPVEYNGWGRGGPGRGAEGVGRSGAGEGWP